MSPILAHLLLILIGPLVAVAGPTLVAVLSWPDLAGRLFRPVPRTAYGLARTAVAW